MLEQFVFPQSGQNENGKSISKGLSKKELFSAFALHAIMSKENITYAPKDAAEAAIKFAEALMNELE